jgi:RNA polymerase sigma-70 factor (ECF subfamily)
VSTRVTGALDGSFGLDQPGGDDGSVANAQGAGPFRGESTFSLLHRLRNGEPGCAEALFERCLPALRKWARGRLPSYARDLADTHDLVQETLLHCLGRLEAFQARHQGALQAYLRQAVYNRIRDEIRRVRRRPQQVELDDVHAAGGSSPLEAAIGRESIDRYEAAMERLRPADREAIVARLELQQSYDEVAIALGKRNADAARMAVKRALGRLAEEMSHGR